MSKRYITADWHLGEDRFRIMQREGFKDAQEMIDHFVELNNKVVNPEDTLLVVGDAVNQKTPEYLEQVSRFNGKKILFRGNHDRVFTDDQLKPYFEEIVPEGEGRDYVVGDINCWITHYPTQGVVHKFNLVGHIHSAWRFQINAVNIGVDVNHYKPHNLDEDIPFFYEAISKFYDLDVWAAYHESNQFVWNYGERGARGRYLDQ